MMNKHTLRKGFEIITVRMSNRHLITPSVKWGLNMPVRTRGFNRVETITCFGDGALTVLGHIRTCAPDLV